MEIFFTRGKAHQNMFPLCGKESETCFHCVEKFQKHGSIVWKTPPGNK